MGEYNDSDSSPSRLISRRNVLKGAVGLGAAVIGDKLNVLSRGSGAFTGSTDWARRNAPLVGSGGKDIDNITPPRTIEDPTVVPEDTEKPELTAEQRGLIENEVLPVYFDAIQALLAPEFLKRLGPYAQDKDVLMAAARNDTLQADISHRTRIDGVKKTFIALHLPENFSPEDGMGNTWINVDVSTTPDGKMKSRELRLYTMAFDEPRVSIANPNPTFSPARVWDFPDILLHAFNTPPELSATLEEHATSGGMVEFKGQSGYVYNTDNPERQYPEKFRATTLEDNMWNTVEATVDGSLTYLQHPHSVPTTT